MEFDPVETILALKADAASADYLAKSRACGDAREAARTKPSKYRAYLVANVQCEQAFAACRRADAKCNRLFAALCAAYDREAARRDGERA
ncbi:hypothetical protein CCR94_16410 [Rhodoblastus sphagnicola]|uniref:Uncharacterized protein n=1 Tax=Rhodoblastus sphagnicola TaxID=333368 RepID=A0A2S6N2X6_9HYPH|nr:hypothetical protein [Rhodoblastus sphagnicola]MBB4199080.1 hypothetical protein [Rhodoblastus sphagnicola]PPQ28973.1 hypothetical protein CCR94_16410 [Rhodoblastus sphagnicola]